MNDDWQKKAACRGIDPQMFYVDPMDLTAVAVAKDICRSCPVILDCLTYACKTRQDVGIWGGQTEIERTCEDIGPDPDICLCCGGDLIPIAGHIMLCIECKTRWSR